MQDDIQRDLERELRKDTRREWAYRHRSGLIIAGMMVAAMGVGAAVTYLPGVMATDDVVEEQEDTGVAATFDGTEISEDDVTAYIDQYRNYAGYHEDGAWATFLDGMSSSPSAMREDAIKALARRLAVDARAEEVGVSVSEEDIDTRVAEEAEKAGHTDDYEEYVTGTLMYPSMDDYRADVRMELLLDLLIDADVRPSDPTDLQMVIYASESTASYIGNRTYDLLVSVPEDAAPTKVLELKATAEAIADKAADCESTEDFLRIADSADAELIDRGWSCLGSSTAAYLEAISELPAGSASEAFRDEDGWHVAWCAETFSVRPDSALSLSEMPQEIYDRLRIDTMESELADAMASYADELLADHDLEINAMPSGLSYDVDMELSYYRQDESDEDAEDIAQSGLDALTEASQDSSVTGMQPETEEDGQDSE